MKKYKVMVTGVGGASGMGTVKSLLGLKDITVVAGDMDPFAAPLYWVPEKVVLPAANNPKFIKRIIDIIRERMVDVIIPNTSEEMLPIAIEKESIEKYTNLLISSAESIKIADDKLNTYNCLNNLGIPVVKTKLVKNEIDVAECIGKFGLPLVLKPRISRGGRGFFVCENMEECSRYFHKLQNMLPFEDLFFLSDLQNQIICQEYLPGGYYDVNILKDSKHNVVACVPGKVERWDVHVHHKRKKMVTEHNEEIERLSKNATRAMNLVGPLDIEIRYDKEGNFKVQEINARPGGDVELATAAGCNISYLTVKLSLGENLDYMDFEEGVFLVRSIWNQAIKKSEVPQD